MDESSSGESDVSGVSFIAARISLGYDALAEAVAQMATHCSRMAVYEHPADAEVSRTHVHLALVEPDIGIEGFKKLVKRHAKIDGKGNEMWSWKQTDGIEQDVDKYVTYMSKGNLSYKSIKGFSSEVVERLRLSWVQPAAKPPAEPKKYDELDHILEDWGKLDAKRVTFDEIRSWVFAWYWRRDGRVPPATQYKRMSGTLFLKIAEVQPQMYFGVALEEVKNLWY